MRAGSRRCRRRQGTLHGAGTGARCLLLQRPSLLLLLGVVLLLPHACGAWSLPGHHHSHQPGGHGAADGEPFIGWHGESFQGPAAEAQAGNADDGAAPRRKWIETISWSPRAFIYHHFLSEEEVKHMLNLVETQVARSYVVDTKTGQSKLDPIRTSYGAAIMRGQTPVVAAIEARIAEWTRLPADHGEPLQVLRYQNGQKYDAHWDWFDDPLHTDKSENRAATVLLYLGDVQEGGETSLPLGVPIDEARQAMVQPSECAAKGTMAVVPVRGDALLFWDMHPNGTDVDRASLHASCPTIRGTKWTATKWIHNRPYGVGGYDPLRLAAECRDESRHCMALAALGKCDTDPSLLGLTGKCRRTCHDCIDCAPGDLICLRKNMRSLRPRSSSSSSSRS